MSQSQSARFTDRESAQSQHQPIAQTVASPHAIPQAAASVMSPADTHPHEMTSPEEACEMDNHPMDAGAFIDSRCEFMNQEHVQVARHQAIIASLSGHGEAATPIEITAHTSDQALAKFASQLLTDSNVSAPEESSTQPAGAELTLLEALHQLRGELRSQDDNWGEISPHLEALLDQGHPNVRLKSAGKYNPSAKRTLLVRTRPGDGGWEPAIIQDNEGARQQWKKAGLDYPFASRSRGDLDPDVGEMQHYIESRVRQAGRSSVTEGLAFKRHLEKKIAAATAQLQALKPVIREENLYETEMLAREYRNVLEGSPSETARLKIRRALIELVLKAISTDAEIGTADLEYLAFARISRLVELDIGRYTDPASIERDHAILVEAANDARDLVGYLCDDDIGQELSLIIGRALA
ncbi:hypothetical protein DU506_01470 [Vreelandella rituensis]|uniref:Uncharacterized protein n=2 Tax=Vreelandella rituensis TaxID=2282306 RepID=A0A368UA48_9GAMM|nr:hypothetical protein DU506_01470 [Halomonas rituensis]